MNLLEFKEVKKRFGKREVLSGVSFNVRDGEIFGLIGGSGSGKSTLFNIVIGMVRSDGGEINFENKNAAKKMRYLRENTGFATQDNMLFNELSIEENGLYFGSLYGMKKIKIKERFNQLIKLLSLGGFEKTLVKNLSGGMTKRANFLVSLIHGPKLLLLDEPTVGLDPRLRSVLWKYIKEINKTGTTILVSSHLLDEIEKNCDRVAILKHGKVIAIGTPKQYKQNYGASKSLNVVFQQLLTDENL
jgi:ABC-2 type transport system ATP-binding protein